MEINKNKALFDWNVLNINEKNKLHCLIKQNPSLLVLCITLVVGSWSMGSIKVISNKILPWETAITCKNTC